MAEPFPRQPTDVWVLTAVKTIRNGLGDDSLVSVDEANAWLNALKSAALDALQALDRVSTVVIEATSGKRVAQCAAGATWSGTSREVVRRTLISR